MNKLNSRARITEVDGLSDSIVRRFKEDADAQTDAFLKATMEEMERQSGSITTAILRDKATSTLDAADAVRDGAIRTLGTVLAGYAVLPVAAKREAAAPLKAVYDKYAKAGITSAAYVSESSMVASMLEDFGAPALAENIAALDGVAEALADIRAAQSAFDAANDAYVDALSSKGESASVYKRALVATINDRLVPYLSAMVIAGNGACAAFAAVTASEIARLNEAVARRGKHGVSAAGSPGDGVEEPSAAAV